MRFITPPAKHNFAFGVNYPAQRWWHFTPARLVAFAPAVTRKRHPTDGTAPSARSVRLFFGEADRSHVGIRLIASLPSGAGSSRKQPSVCPSKTRPNPVRPATFASVLSARRSNYSET